MEHLDSKNQDVERTCWMIVHEHCNGAMPTEYDIDYTFDFTGFCSEYCSESSDNVFIVKAWVSDSAGRTSLDWIRVQFNYEESDNDDSQ